MPAQPQAVGVSPDRFSLTLSGWTGGANSLQHPTQLNKNQYAWGENILNRGGIVQTRPGQFFAGKQAGSNLQGFYIFTPINSTARMLLAVDGRIYVASWPKFIFTEVKGLSLDSDDPNAAPFNPAAPMVQFCECLQSVRRKPDHSLERIEPLRVLMIGDGETATGYYDGTNAKRLVYRAPDWGTPTALWMVWTSSVLWVANGNRVMASDIGDPTSFYDNTFLAEKSDFEMPGEITGMIETTSRNGLLVFTESTTSAIQSSIRPRTQWQSTADFVRVVFPRIGCTAGRSIINQYGLTYWLSAAGVVGLDAALNTDRSSRLLTLDGAMMRSKRNLSPNMSGACAVAFENMALFSVPSGGKRNGHSWVLDQAPLDDQTTGGGVWSGIWTGTNPVQWAEGNVGGRKRLYYASYDRTPVGDTHIHVWEAMRDERNDAGGRIHSQVEFPCVSSDRTQTFKYAEFDAVEILGNVTLEIFVSGTKGEWYPIGVHELRAEEGSIGSPIQRVLTLDSVLEAFKPQSRTLRTNEFSSQGKTCSPEMAGRRPGHDKGFSLLFVWRGRMGLREIRIVMGPDSTESDRGGCAKNEDGQVNMVNERGEVVV